MSCEMLSQDGDALPNILRVYEQGRYVYLEIEGKHDGVKLCQTVKVERCVFSHHIRASGILP